MKATITNTTLTTGGKGGDLRLLPINTKPSVSPPQPIVLHPGESAQVETSATVARWIIEEA
jgi:hypothetical protein